MCLHGEITISRRWARKALLGYFALCDINVLFHGARVACVFFATRTR